jgi:hypothetical protein
MEKCQILDIPPINIPIVPWKFMIPDNINGQSIKMPNINVSSEVLNKRKDMTTEKIKLID